MPRGGVDDSGGNHYTRRHTAGIGFFEDGVQAVSRAVEPEPGVVGFPACGERRSRGGRVGYTIVGRMGLHESGHRSPLHLDRAVFVLDHQGRDVGQPHSVTDHQDYVFDLFGLLLFFRGFRSERRCGQQDPGQQRITKIRIVSFSFELLIIKAICRNEAEYPSFLLLRQIACFQILGMSYSLTQAPITAFPSRLTPR